MRYSAVAVYEKLYKKCLANWAEKLNRPTNLYNIDLNWCLYDSKTRQVCGWLGACCKHTYVENQMNFPALVTSALIPSQGEVQVHKRGNHRARAKHHTHGDHNGAG